MKTSKRFTEINNIRGITTKLQLEFAHNPEHFPPCFFSKSGSRLKFSNVPAKWQLCALSFIQICKIQFWYYFIRMDGTTTTTATTWFLHYYIIFKMGRLHPVRLWTFMRYVSALNIYLDTQPKLNIYKTYIYRVFTGNPTSIPSR